MSFRYRVNYRYGSMRRIGNVVADHKDLPVEKDMPVEITQDEESGETEPIIPEGVWNPGIQVIIGRGWRIVGNHRGAIIIIVVVDNLRAWISGEIICRRFRPFFGWSNGEAGRSFLLDRFELIPVLLGDGFIPVGVMRDPVFISIFVNSGITRLAA
jgi:hypothetical protein